jgi:hypothetical protein
MKNQKNQPRTKITHGTFGGKVRFSINPSLGRIRLSIEANTPFLNTEQIISVLELALDEVEDKIEKNPPMIPIPPNKNEMAN